MKPIILFLIFFLMAGSAAAQPSTPEYNFGFEKKSNRGELPDQWLGRSKGYRHTTDTITVRSGKRSVLIEPLPNEKNEYGSVIYKTSDVFDANLIEVRCYLKWEGVTDGPVGLLLQIDGPAGQAIAFDNLMRLNIQGTRDWTLFSVILPYPEEAQGIQFGPTLTGKGKLWVDDFEVLLDDKDIREAKTRKPKVYKAPLDKEFNAGSRIAGITLNDSRKEDLVALGKVWGFLKYYHPTVASGDLNWDYELFRILPKVLSVQNAAERNAVLNAWVTSLGEVQKSEKKDDGNREIKAKPDVAWINAASLGEELTASLRRVLEAQRTGKNYYVAMSGGLGNPEFKNETPYGYNSYPDQGLRLLSLYRYWNMIQYFYPYKNLMDDEWNNVLSEYLPRFVNASNTIEYKLATLSLIGKIQDTHANIWGGDGDLASYRGHRVAAVKIQFAENKAVVASYYDDRLGAETAMKIGDVIEEVNGKRVDEIIKSRLDITPASNYPTQLRDMAPNLLRTNDSVLNIKYRRDGKLFTTRMKTYGDDQINPYARPAKKDTCFRMIGQDIAYLYPGTWKNEYLSTIMAQIKQTKGLIIDLRCYPSDFMVFTVSEYLQPAETAIVKWSNGSVLEPGLFTMREGHKVGKANADNYKGKVVILINETTQSQAEYTAMAFRTVPGAVVVGSTTAGADGNVSRIVLPGGIKTMISGLGVYYPDGRETQRVGIVPDVEMKPTIKGIKEGKDEVLDKGLAIINEKMEGVRTGKKK